MNKSEVREKMHKLRASMSSESRSILSRDIAKKVFAEIIRRDFQRVMCYYSYKGEVDTHELVKMLKKSGIQVALPRMETGRDMTARIWNKESLVPNKYGIQEPPASAEKMENIEAVIMPGLAFDYNGTRLGYGGGYFDRFLQNRDAYRIGICFDAQLLRSLPSEEFDIPMNTIITDCRVIEL